MIKLTDLLPEFFSSFKKKQSPAQKPVKRKAGDVGKTAGGKFASSNRANPNYTRYFDTEEKARAYATAKIKKAPVKDEPIAEPDQKRSDFIKQSLEKDKQKRKARFAPKKDEPKKKDGEDMEILRQLQQTQNDEPEKKRDNFKFGGGGGFSGGGSGGKF